MNLHSKINLHDNELSIRRANIEDASILCEWWNDGNVMAHAGFPCGLMTSVDKIKELFKNPTQNRLIIELNKKPIGEMSYKEVSSGVVEIGIKICDFSKQNQGYGSRYLKLLIDFLFNVLNYSKIILDTNINNLRAQHVYEKLGFKKVNVRYNSWVNQIGEVQSAVDYELIKIDYYKTSK